MESAAESPSRTGCALPTALLPGEASRVASDPMFNPDLGYYVRALRAGKRVIAVWLLAGAVVGLLIGTFGSGRDWEASQLVRIDKTAVSTSIDERSLLSFPRLPDRKVLDEAALIRVLAAELDVPSSIIVVPDDAAGSIKVFSSGGSKTAVTRDLQTVLDAYRKDRVDDYGQRITEAIDVASAQAKTSQASLDKLDLAISATPADATVLGQALVAQRAEVVQFVESSAGAQAYLEDFGARQTGGATLLGNLEFKQEPPTGSGLTLAIVLGLLGAVVGAIVALVRRNIRGQIESAADLALFSSIVSIGDLANIDPRVLDKIAMAAPSGTGSGKVFITESLVGSMSSQLREALAVYGIDAAVCPCVCLPNFGACDHLVVAVDHIADTEQTVDDLLELLADVVPRPILAVLC